MIADHGTPIRDKTGRIYRVAGVARDITEEKRLQAEVQKVSEAERQRLGRDLHDGLCQHLTGIAMQLDLLQKKLQAKNLPEAAAAGQLSAHARDAVAVSHDLSRGLYPASLQITGLATALEELTRLVEKMFSIRCQFRDGNVPRLADTNLERQLFRIAQEATFNAAKHSRGKHVWIELRQTKQWLTLTVQDDGIGASPAKLEASDMGLNIMRYRANLIGATLTIDAQPGRGTTITCKLRNHNK